MRAQPCGPVAEQTDPGSPEEPDWPGRPLDVNRADLLRGSVSVGQRRSVTLLRDPARRASEIHGLAGLLDAYVAFGEQGPRRSAFFDELDSREKASFSYRLGLGVALLTAQHELAIPWVMHLGSLLDSGSARLDPEDAPQTVLLGLSRTGRWHLVKAKARSSEMTDALVEDALADVAHLATVNDRPPVERRACVTALGQDPFLVAFAGTEDRSKEDEGEAPRIETDPSAYVTEYYAQFSFLTSLETDRRPLADEPGCGNLPPAILADLGGTGYRIGLLEPLFSALLPPDERTGGDESLDEAVPGPEGWAPDEPEKAREAGLSVGRDGVVVTGPATGEAP